MARTDISDGEKDRSNHLTCVADMGNSSTPKARCMPQRLKGETTGSVYGGRSIPSVATGYYISLYGPRKGRGATAFRHRSDVENGWTGTHGEPDIMEI